MASSGARFSLFTLVCLCVMGLQLLYVFSLYLVPLMVMELERHYSGSDYDMCMFGVVIKNLCPVFITNVDKIKYRCLKQSLSSENGA